MPDASKTPAASFWEQNTALLRSRYPELAKQIGYKAGNNEHIPANFLPRRTQRDTEENKKIESLPCETLYPPWLLKETSSGNPTLLFKENPDSPEILIHSQRDPVKEGLRQAEEALKENAETIIILGFGLGYTAEALAKTNSALIIVERHIELFTLAMESRNLEPLLSPGRALFVMGDDPGAINAALGLIGTEGQKPLVIKNRALTALTTEDESWYNEAARRINAWVSKEEINAATLRRFGKRWTRNLAANMEGVLHFPGVKSLENILQNTEIPVFLAAAGPSLNTVENILEEIRSRCVIAAADTSLRFLLTQGIEPDFVVSVDPQYWNTLHLHRLAASNTALIAESAVYPSVLNNSSFGRIFFCQSLFPLGRFIEDRTDPKGILGAGGSVATTAWDFARLLGPPSIWAAGLDLAFPGYRTHYKGALFEENAHAVSGLFCPAETLSVAALENGIPFIAASANGGKVLTDKRLSLYASWFENRIGQTGPANYNLSPGGLAVPGFVIAQPEDILSLPCRRDEINKILQNIFCRIDKDYNSEKENRAKRYSLASSALVSGLEEIRDSAAEAASVARRGLASNRKQPAESETLLKKLDKANAAIAASPVKDAAGFLFPSIAELEKKLHETDPLKRHLEFSLSFYQSLSESVEYTLKQLKRAFFGNF